MIGKKLTDNSYILTNMLGEKVALVFEREGVFISTHDNSAYESLEAIAKAFSESFEMEKTKKEVEPIFVSGYPIKHAEAYNIENEKYPTYGSKLNSKIRYAAGWWIIQRNSSVVSVLSPKITTLDETSCGPYKDSFEANVILSGIKKDIGKEE